MPAPKRIFESVEVDVPQCVNTFGVYTIEPVVTPSVTKADGDAVLSSEVFREQNMTAVFEITVPASPQGIVYEQGGSGIGIYLGFSGSNLIFRAGNGAVTPNANTAIVQTFAATLVGKSLKIVTRVNPTAGRVAMTIIEAGEVLVNLENTASGGFPIDGTPVFAGSEAGAIGQLNLLTVSGVSTANYNGTITSAKFWNNRYEPLTGCIARLTSQRPHKCWQLRGDCGDLPRYTPGTPLTLRFCKEKAIPPKDGLQYFPVLGDRVRMSSASVNIAGSDPEMSGLGRSATLDFTLSDFLFHERGFDKYVQERLSGAAQFTGIGYDPAQFFWLAKVKQRWPDYADNPVRYRVGYLVDGVLQDVRTRNYFLKEWDGPNDQTHSLKCRGVLNFTDKITALAPRPSSGVLSADLTAVATSFTLTPAGVGNLEYPASGEVCLGSEIMSFTRVNDTMTVTRGIANTVARAHTSGATVQLVLKYTDARMDDVLNDLVENYTDTPATYLRTAVKNVNAAEVDVWASTIRLNTRLVAPTSVALLMSELADLGFIIWENDEDQSINLRANRPFVESPRIITDNRIKSIKVTDNDKRRLTQVRFLTKRFDQTKQLSDESNYELKIIRINPDATQIFDAVRSKTIVSRWLDQGDANAVSILTFRYLNRFSRAPRTWEITLDAEEEGVELVEVVQLETDQSPSSAGETRVQFVQVFERMEPIPNHEITILCQQYQFDGKYAVIGPNTLPTYGSATDEQKRHYAWIAPSADGFNDGTEAYRIT